MGDRADHFRHDEQWLRMQCENADREEARGLVPAPVWRRTEPRPSHEDLHPIDSHWDREREDREYR